MIIPVRINRRLLKKVRTTGYIGFTATEKGLLAVTLPYGKIEEAEEKLLQMTGNLYLPEKIILGDKTLLDLAENLQRYYWGEKCDFDYPIDLEWCTPFQKQVLQGIRRIPYGETRTYSQVASMVNSPRSARAVGNALHQNKTLLILPCHRVICANGSLGGFGAGFEWKERLINLENMSQLEKNKFLDTKN